MLKIFIIFVSLNAVFCNELLSVVVIYRHGNRTPVKPYPTDPYKNASYWPVGFGQLTNLGKQQHYHLGQWLRKRYDGFLPSDYSEKDIYIRSTDTDRTLMSAATNLAGLYPPKEDQIWDPSIPWQPIPVHTIPEFEDNLFAMKKNCPKYNSLLNQLFETDYFLNVSHINQELYAYLTKNSGTEITSLKSLKTLYSTMFIETLNGYVLPDWAQEIFPDKLKPWAELSFATLCYTQDLARLKTGPLFHEIVEHFFNATRGQEDYRKFLVFSGHDGTIANVLNTMGAFQYHCPPFASTIMFELRQNTSFTYVNIFYKNSSILQNITLNGCGFNCDFNTFVNILKPILITRKEWDFECQLSLNYVFQMGGLGFIIYLSAVVGILVFVFLLRCVAKCCRIRRSAASYNLLPSSNIS